MSRFPWLILMMAPLLAQAPSANVVGRVVDVSGAVIPGATIKITNLDTNQTYRGTSNGAGDYTVLYLSPGRYWQEATSVGWGLQTPGIRAAGGSATAA